MVSYCVFLRINHRHVSCLFASRGGKYSKGAAHYSGFKWSSEDLTRKKNRKKKKNICWPKTFRHCSFGIHLTSIINAEHGCSCTVVQLCLEVFPNNGLFCTADSRKKPTHTHTHTQSRRKT